jgi:hypothetical protein
LGLLSLVTSLHPHPQFAFLILRIWPMVFAPRVEFRVFGSNKSGDVYSYPVVADECPTLPALGVVGPLDTRKVKYGLTNVLAGYSRFADCFRRRLTHQACSIGLRSIPLSIFRESKV